MVVANGDFAGSGLRPAEDDPPLVVDPDGVKPFEIALEGLESVSGGNREVGESPRMVHLEEFSKSNASNGGKATVAFLVKQFLSIFVGEGLDHG